MARKIYEPDQTITEASQGSRIWLEATTMNILPGEEISIQLAEESGLELAPGTTEMEFFATIDEEGKGRILLGNQEPDEEFIIDEPEEEAGQPAFENAWWSLDIEGEQKIKRALPGMQVYFHIETSGIADKETVYLAMYDDDNNEQEEGGQGDRDDRQSINVNGRLREYFEGQVIQNKVVVQITPFVESALRNEVDKVVELYFRCSYKKVNVELPFSTRDYLSVGSMVIDRYKMPGLDEKGVDIASDLTYGYGEVGLHHFPAKDPERDDYFIYSKQQIDEYKCTYQEKGFDENEHSLYSNRTDFPSTVQPRISKHETLPHENPIDNLIIDDSAMGLVDYNAISDSNRKAIYSTEKTAGLGRLMRAGMDAVNWTLWFDLRLMEELMVWGSLSPVLTQLIHKFKRNEGGVFEDAKLTKSVQKNPSTKRYCTWVEDYIAEHLKTNLGELEKVEDKIPTFSHERAKRIEQGKVSDQRSGGQLIPFTKPSFPYSRDFNLVGGRTLALNDIWSTEVKLLKVETAEDDYTATYQITLYDHFGLDYPDMTKFFYYGAGFRAWFILQHVKGFKPFITKMQFTQSFKGNICIGRKERVEERAEARRLKEAQRQKEAREKLDRIQDFPIGPKI